MSEKFKAWLPVALWMGLIFLGSSLPGASVSANRTVDFAAHKLIHLIEYAVLFLLVQRALRRTFLRRSTLVALLITVAFAVSDELHQSFVSGRDGRVSDVVIDAASALVGWLVVHYRARLYN